MNPTVSIFAPLNSKRKKETLFTLRKEEIDKFVDEIFVRRPRKDLFLLDEDEKVKLFMVKLYHLFQGT